jgi:endoglucanase
MRVMVVVLALLAAFSSVSASGAPAPATLLADGWRQYRERFVTAEGRVVDNANGGISHSEGQGYAMLIAERLDDRPTFETIWRWTQSNLLVRGDGLAAWRWSPETPHVADHNNATDGDLLIAWALAESSDRWHVSEYKDLPGRSWRSWRRMLLHPAASVRFCCRLRRDSPARISLTVPSSISPIGSFPPSSACVLCQTRSIGMRSLRPAKP